jgi:ubiquinone/menaquinone biosynthesis C-methylase UbiE
VLEIGPGTGHALVALAGSVGPAGQVIGVDLSARMLGRSRRRAVQAGETSRTRLIQADAHRLPLRAGAFDALFMSFVLELTDTPQIPALLDGCRRVLRPGTCRPLQPLSLSGLPTTAAAATPARS